MIRIKVITAGVLSDEANKLISGVFSGKHSVEAVSASAVTPKVLLDSLAQASEEAHDREYYVVDRLEAFLKMLEADHRIHRLLSVQRSAETGGLALWVIRLSGDPLPDPPPDPTRAATITNVPRHPGAYYLTLESCELTNWRWKETITVFPD